MLDISNSIGYNKSVENDIIFNKKGHIMIMTLAYDFELKGVNYESIGSDIGDTACAEDIFSDCGFSIEDEKREAIYNALISGKTLSESEEEEILNFAIQNAKFKYLKLSCEEQEREYINA